MKNFLFLSVFIFVFNCSEKQTTPKNIISVETMSDIIYDMTLISVSKGVNRKILENNGFKVEKIFNVQNMPFLYKFRFFRRYDHKDFNESIARREGYKLPFFGNLLQSFLIKFFPSSFCNVYLAIAKKK